MRYLSVCSGIEAASVAWKPLGWKALAFSEIEEFPRAVLQHHYPDVPLYGDFTKLRDESWIVDADILVGGTPCQGFSTAGLRGSLSDDRSNLALEFIRLANAIDDLRCDAGRKPVWICWENVPGVLSVSDNAFGAFLGGLVEHDTAIKPPQGRGWTDAGVVSGPKRVAAWRCLDAQYHGLAQRRKRVFVLALGGTGGWASADALLPIIDSLQGHPPPSRKAGARITQALTRSFGAGSADDNRYQASHYIDAALEAGEPVSFDWQAGGDGDTSFRGKSRSYTVRKPGASGSIQRNKVEAVAIPPSPNEQGSIAVRRLTPREAERLQGFQDDYTLVPYRGKPASDGPRYKAIGNSMAVPCMAYLGRRIQMVEDILTEAAAQPPGGSVRQAR